MNKEFIDELITDLSYRLLDGTPDLTNNDHLIVLRQVMEEKGLSHELIEKTMKNLRIPVKKNPNSTNPTKFSVDFDGVHSDQAESMPYIDAYKPQDRADQDKLPMDDRDDEERDTPENEEIVLELDYLDDEECDTPEDESVNELYYLDVVQKLNEDWWSELSSEDQQKYIQAHPKSQKAIEAKKEKDEPVEKDKGEILSDEQKNEMRTTDHKETDKALTFTKEQADAEKKAKKRGEVLGRGLGTPKSRAGEAATHYAIRQLSKGQSLDEIKESLMKIANQKDTFLEKDWVDGALNTTKFIVEKFGIDNIDEVVWDTPEGRKLIGVEGHGTPSDMFITTKDGKRIGISLKKDGDVFLVNDGYEKALPNLLADMSDEDQQKIIDTAGIQTYVKDRNDKIWKTINLLNGEMKNDLNESIKQYKANPEAASVIFGPKYEKYLSILENTDVLVDKVESGKKIKVDEMKAIARVIGRKTSIYEQHPELYNDIKLADNRLISRLLKNFHENPKFAVTLKKSIINKVHVKELLNLEQNPKLNEFMTVYGESPDGVELSKDSLLELFGEKTKKLYEIKEGFEQAKTPEEKKKYSNAIIKNINNNIYIDFKDGARDGVIKIKHEDGKEYPIFTVSTRTRGIGNPPVLEIHQTPYMANALKFKSFDTEKWSPLQRNNFLKKLRKEYEERIKDNAGNPGGQKELIDSIKKIDAKLNNKEK